MLNPSDSLSNLENLDKSTLIAMIMYHRKNEERQKQAKLGLAVSARDSVSSQPTPQPPLLAESEGSPEPPRSKTTSSTLKLPPKADALLESSSDKPRTPRKGRSLRRKQSVQTEDPPERTRGLHRTQSVSAAMLATSENSSPAKMTRKKSLPNFTHKIQTVTTLSDSNTKVEVPPNPMGETHPKVVSLPEKLERKKVQQSQFIQINRLEAKFILMDEFLSDSPLFRKKLKTSVAATEGFLEALSRLANHTENACTFAQGHSRQMESVASSLNAVREYLAGGSTLDEVYKKSCLFINSLQETRSAMVEGIINDFVKPVRYYAETQLKEILQMSHDYNNIVREADQTLSKYAKKVTTKTSHTYAEVEAIEKKRQDIGLSLINRLNSIALPGKIDFLASTISLITHLMNYYTTSISQCINLPVDYQDLLEQLEAAKPKVNQIISTFHSQSSEIPKLVQDPKSMRGFMHYQILSSGKNTVSESHKTPWDRAYFSIDYGYFILSSLLGDDGKLQKTRWNILYCGNVKPRNDLDRSFTWEMTAMSQDTGGKMKPKLLVLQCDSAELKTQWMTCVQQTIQDMLSNQKSVSTTSRVKVPILIQNSLTNKNPNCVDCGAAGPDWASLNLGVMMCIQCSGAHRSLSTSISKVRSITLDVWDVYAYKLLEALGNSEFNKLMQHGLPSIPIDKDSSQGERESFIRSKYIQKSFLVPVDKKQDQNANLLTCCLSGELSGALAAILYGADPNHTDPNGVTVLVKSITSKQYLSAQLLLSNGALTETKCGSDGWTALHYVAKSNDADGIALLISAGASKEIKDKNGKTAEALCKKPLTDALSRAFLGFVPKESAALDDSNLDSSSGRIMKKHFIEKEDHDQVKKEAAQGRIQELFEQQNCSSSGSETEKPNTKVAF